MDQNIPLPPVGAVPISAPPPMPPMTAGGDESGSAIPPPPQGAVSYNPPPPPVGALPLDIPAPPQGAVPLEATQPDPIPPPQMPNTGTPGFWPSIGSAFGRGFTQNVADAVAGSRVVLPPGQGGTTLEDQFKESLLHPETQDEITKLTQQKLYAGWRDPKWWAVNIAHGVGGMTPALGAGAVGALAGPIGAIGGFVSESALSSLVPAYKAARAQGLDPDDATKRALIDSGIAAAGALAMGLAPEVALFGRAASPAGAEAIEVAANAFKRPVMETLAQLGVVQPLIADTQHLVTSLSHGETPGTEDLLTTHALGTAMGVVPVGAHAVLRGLPKGAEQPVAPASEEVVGEAFRNQQTTPNTVAPSLPNISATEETLYPRSREERIFYSRVKEAVEQKVPDNATPEQVIASIKNHPGVKDEEILDLALPGWLAGQNGRVSKADLLAHIESNGLVLEEAQAAEPELIRMARQTAEAENGPGSWNRIGGGGQENYLSEARRIIQTDYVKVLHANEDKYGYNHDKWPEEAKAATAEKRVEVEKRLHGERQVEYPGQVLPGEHSNYREFVLKVPPRGEPIVNKFEVGIPRGWQTVGDISDTSLDKTKNYTNAHWPNDTNPIAHIRVTDRIDRDGRTLLHVEEIQSDVHQEGRIAGYRDSDVRSYEAVQKDRRAIEPQIEGLKKKYKTSIDNLNKIGLKAEDYSILAEWNKLSAEWIKVQRDTGKVPDLPFKTSWKELAVKRVLRLAADEGYDGVSWANGDQIGVRLATERQLNGAREFYDKQITGFFKKWGAKLGAPIGETKFYDQQSPNFHPTQEQRIKSLGLDPYKIKDTNSFLAVNPAFSERVRMGFSLYDEGVKRKHTLSEAFVKGTPKALQAPGKKIIAAIGDIAKGMNISLPLNIVVGPRAAQWRGRAERKDGKYIIYINTRLLRSAEDVYATGGHELGHVIMWDKFASAPKETRLQVEEAFRQFRTKMNNEARTVGDVRRIRDNAVSEMTEGRNPSIGGGEFQNDIPLSDLAPGSRAYLLHYKEWFAEQGAKWMTTSEKPLSRVDKFFAELGKTIRGLIEKFNSLRARPATAEKVLQDWFDSLLAADTDILATIKDQTAKEGILENQDALARDGTPEVSPTAQTASTVGGRNIVGNLPPDARGAGNAAAAHADRMNKFYEWMTSLPQIAELNKHIRGLTMYKEGVALMNKEKNDIVTGAWETLRAWKLIREPGQQIALGRFIEDYMNGMFKDPSDQSGTIRRPTKKEFADLVVKHKLGDQAVKIFDRVRADFDNFLEKYRQLLLEDAGRIKDAESQRLAIESIHRRVDNLLERPYFPAMRFGKYTITVYDSAKNVRHFEQTDSLRKQRKIKEALEKSTDLLPGDVVRVGEVAKDAAPLLGMPPGLLDLMADKLSLSTTQRNALDQLRFDYAPSQSFRHQFKSKDLTPGYSSDFQRAYAHFFFHGANHFTRVKYIDQLRDEVRNVKTESVEMLDANKRDRIANYMTEHLGMLMDPKPDFAALRGLMFHWYLGFNPASATLNLSQTVIMTYPHLASKFGGAGIGDLKAVGALTRASADLNNFYKKGNLLERSELHPPGSGGYQGSSMRAIGEAVREGVISETQAHTLAAISENRNLLRAFGSKGEEAWQNFSEASSWMFEMTEQYNRRVAFRAAWDLAMRDPNNKYVSETVRDNPLQYKRLIEQGWTHQEASAFTAAKHTTEATQFVYAPYSRPKFMWGRKGALFIFKSFTQNTLFNLYNNPAGAARSLLILGALGGMMGLPGMEDINGILKTLAWRLFSKDFDVEDEARKFAVDILKGVIGPDMLLHGMSVHGFGLPHVMNALGGSVGLPRFFPTMDRHGSIGMGNILPFEPGKLGGPSKDVKGNELAQIQRASGAGFSNIFALYNFLNSQSSIGDLKRWEGIMPRFMSNLSHAWRYHSEGLERNRAGGNVIKFDPNDTEQMAEILGRAMGYQPRRLIAQYETIQAKQEAATYWDLRKGILLRQFGTALQGKNLEEKERVIQAIRNYNNELPAEAKAKGISGQVLRESVQARMRNNARTEQGLPTSKQNFQLFKSLDKYFPEGKPTGLTGVVPVK